MTGELSLPVFERLSEMLSTRMGLYFPPERKPDLERALTNACPDFGFSTLPECADWLIRAPMTKPQVETLAAHLTIGETYFFRERRAYDFLLSDILPAIQRVRPTGQRQLRIWSAGCCTGEEPYSIAMLVAMNPTLFRSWDVSILATDINPLFLARAEAGRYGQWSFRNVEEGIRARFFHPVAGNLHELSANIRGMVDFRHLNLVEDGWPSLLTGTNAMDIIFCRNVLMYFNEETRTRVVGRLRNALVDGGWLIVSLSEISHLTYANFTTVSHPGIIVYRKSPSPGATGGIPHAPAHPRVHHAPPVSPRFVPELTPAPRRVPVTAIPPGGAGGDWRRQRTLAQSLYDSGDYTAAITEMEAACARPPSTRGRDVAEGLLLMAKCHAHLGRLDASREWCERALASDKMLPEAHYLLATVLLEEGRNEDAQNSLRRALYLDQNFVLALFTLGSMLRREQRLRDAEKHFDAALTALRALPDGHVIPESDGMTVSQLRELIETLHHREEA